MARMLDYWANRAKTGEFKKPYSPNDKNIVVMREQLTRHVKADGVVIDLGCGTGRAIIALKQYFPHMKFIGLDFNPTQIDFKLCPEVALWDITESGLPKADFLYTMTCLMHIPPDEIDDFFGIMAHSVQKMLLLETDIGGNSYCFPHDYPGLFAKYDCKYEVVDTANGGISKFFYVRTPLDKEKGGRPPNHDPNEPVMVQPPKKQGRKATRTKGWRINR